jgi:hypothetical protein
MDWKPYRRIGTTLCRPYVKGEDLTGVSVSEPDEKDLAQGSDDFMIAQNPKKDGDAWLISGAYFRLHYEESSFIDLLADLLN